MLSEFKGTPSLYNFRIPPLGWITLTPAFSSSKLNLMPSRVVPFTNGEIYHIYNRGSEKRPIFDKRSDYKRFLKTLSYYQLEGPKPKLSHFSFLSIQKPDPLKKIVEILAYCLMPNHFHLILKQLSEKGVTEFMSKLSNSYTKYYNTKNNRVGPLFQGEFKSVLVESDEQLIHLSRYIHLNPLASALCKNPEDYEWSSYNEYFKNIAGICFKEIVLSLYKNSFEYKEFVLDQADYARELEIIKHQLIDESLG